MKEQDARVDDDYQLVLYVEREDGTYGPLRTGSFMKANYFADFIEHRKEVQEEELAKLCRGTTSTIAYYMVLLNLGEQDLAQRIGISVRKLRKHLRPDYFSKLALPILQQYAEVFGIPVANLFQIPASANPEVRIAQAKTANPLVVITRAEPLPAHD